MGCGRTKRKAQPPKNFVAVPLLQADRRSEWAVPQVTDDTVEGLRLIPQESIHQRIFDEVGDVPLQQVLEKIVEVFKVLPQQRVLRRSRGCPCRKSWRISLKRVSLYLWSASTDGLRRRL